MGDGLSQEYPCRAYNCVEAIRVFAGEVYRILLVASVTLLFWMDQLPSLDSSTAREA